MASNLYFTIRFGVIFLLLIGSSLVFGQNKTVKRHETPNKRSKKEKNTEPLDSTELYRPNWAIKFTPTALLEYTPGLQFGIEKKTARHQALALDAAYIFRYEKQNSAFKGYKIGAEYRFYKDWKSGKKENSYIGFRSEWKQSLLEGESFFWRDNWSYRQILSYRSVTNTKNFFFIFGRMHPIRNRKHWAIETKWGLGTRLVHTIHKNVPSDARLTTNEDSFFTLDTRQTGRYNFINFLARIKVVYLLD